MRENRSLIDHYQPSGNPRTPLVGVKGFAYWNLHRSLYSLIDLETGRVVAREKTIRMSDVRFRVRPAGYRQVVESGVKTVHAGIVGTVTGVRGKRPSGWRRVTYNPFREPCFTDSSGACVTSAKEVLLLTVDGRPRVYALGLQERGW